MGVSAREHPESRYEGRSFGARNNYYDLNTKANYDFNIGAGIGYGREARWGSLFTANPIVYIKDETRVPMEATGELTMTPLEARKLIETFWQEHGFSDMGVLSVFLANNQDTETMKLDEHDPLWKEARLRGYLRANRQRDDPREHQRDVGTA